MNTTSTTQDQQLSKIYEKLEKLDCIKDMLDEILANQNADTFQTVKIEQFYQKHLEVILNGTHMKCAYGIADIVTNDCVYEIKEWRKYRDVISQLRSYNVTLKKPKMAAIFFGRADGQLRKKAVDLLKHENISVFEVGTEHGSIDLKSVHIIACDHFEIHDWLNQNVQVKHDGLLHLKHLSTRFFGDDTHSKKKSEFKLMVEDWIKRTHPLVHPTFRDSKHINVRFRGWKGLALVEHPVC